jgi:ankyrin repeat protein
LGKSLINVIIGRHWAIIGDVESLEMVNLLLDHGVELVESGAAITAAEVEKMDAMALLVDKGIDLEEQVVLWMVTNREFWNSKGTTLYRACPEGKNGAVKFLIKRGANVDAVNKVGGRRGRVHRYDKQ